MGLADSFHRLFTRPASAGNALPADRPLANPPETPTREQVQAAVEVLRRTHFREIQTLGFQFRPADFYCPLDELDFLEANPDLWKGEEPCAGIDWNIEQQVATARIVGRHVRDLADVPEHPRPNDGLHFHWQNDFWNGADALVQYGLVREWKPRRYVEIGCGWSSLLLARAIQANAARTEVVQIEPYPNQRIFERLPVEWTHHRTILQRAPLELFDRLEAGDVCFYDGSHCARTASDVNWFFFRVLPRLASGVYVHLHDIFLPESYPAQWIFERGQTWNEQYLLQAFLMNNDAWEIVIANRYLWLREGNLLDELYQGVQPSWGCSFWLRKR